MHFLITNDDGYNAPGIQALEQALQSIGKVTVVAPSRHLSGCSHRVTTDQSITVTQRAENHFEIGGMPADCVRVGLTHLKLDPDWIVSGINEGANLGCDLCYSGTVAAAREAILFGKRAIALSHYLTPDAPIEWEVAAARSKLIVSELLSQTLPDGSLWNVNLPQSNRLQADTPTVICPVDPSPLAVSYDLTEDSLQYRHGRYHDRPRLSGTDVDLCFSGKITVSCVPVYSLGSASNQ